MPSKIPTLGVEQVYAATYFVKAKQLCEAASAEFDADRSDASMVLAIHAGISAADAVCIGLGTRKNKDSHERAADLLEEVGGHSDEFKDAAKKLRALIAGEERDRIREQARDAQGCGGRHPPLQRARRVGRKNAAQGQAHLGRASIASEPRLRVAGQ